LFTHIESGNKAKRAFSPKEKKHLGKYIYALIDPRDNKVFYVGQGTGNRLFEHLSDADRCLAGNAVADSRLMRIIDIWANEEDVFWAIIAHGINSDSNAADLIESSVIDAFSLSQNGPALNSIAGIHSTLLLPKDLEKVNAEPVNPTSPYPAVFMFWIHKGLAEGRSVYDATRYSWDVNEYYLGLHDAYAVGILEGLSVGSFRIDEWKHTPDKMKHFFNGEPHEELRNLDWRRIISDVRGFVQRGGYPVVEFDGEGNFRILRGNPDKGWRSLVK